MVVLHQIHRQLAVVLTAFLCNAVGDEGLLQESVASIFLVFENALDIRAFPSQAAKLGGNYARIESIGDLSEAHSV